MAEKLPQMLSDWTKEGIISSDQANKILVFESNRKQTSWLFTGFLILGAIVIGLGVISLVASNWQQIPDTVKLIADFLILIATAAALFKGYKTNSVLLFETCLVLFLIFILASIGLIAQIYNTGGYAYQALALWCLLAFPISIFARKAPTPIIWVGLFYLAIGSYCIERLQNIHHLANLYLPLIFTLPFLSALFYLGLSVLKLQGTAYAKAFKFWLYCSAFVAVISAEIGGFGYHTPELKYFIVGHILGAISLLLLWLNWTFQTTVQKTMLTATALLYITHAHIGLSETKHSVWQGVFSILIAITCALYFAGIKRVRFFNLLLSIVGIRFLILYFQAFGGLAYTGFGLIISGAVIIGTVYLLNKYKAQIAAKAEGMFR